MYKKFIVKGLVQGIGYRPFVAKIAEKLNIKGFVRNTGGIVTVAASGTPKELALLKEGISVNVPTGGFITSIGEAELTGEELAMIETAEEFVIIESNSDSQGNLPLIPADIATCPVCERELLDKANRRYLHPFISCTVCGPRYSIIERLPYDRDTITMADFKMCPSCKAEYQGQNDRRRHAQTIACKDCGPKLSFFRIKDKVTDNVTECGKVDNIVDMHNALSKNSEISMAAAMLMTGGIVAIKDIGGYHLACNPFDEKAVAALRLLKHREEKAFAVMFADVEQIKEYCKVCEQEQLLLESSARPIVLMERKENVVKEMADNVCLSSPDIGAMLPSNPVQIMLSKVCGPLIMTSGNASGDVLEINDEKMLDWLKERAASREWGATSLGILSHNRRILRPMDDSVMKVVAGRNQFIRRGRGHVPNPISVDISGEIYAAGGDLKSSFCYLKNGLAYVSQYLGDLEAVSCQSFYKNEMNAMKQIFGFKPDRVVVDLHPGYFSRKFGESFADENGLTVQEIQHHKSHVAAVIAEHHLKGTVIGFAFDGTGYGEDETIWGSEVFITEKLPDMKRVAHLKPMKLIGGNEGAKNCDTILTAFLHGHRLQPPVTNQNNQLIMAALDKNINTITSTSMGRLFDAVAALLDICHYNSYEGQAPVFLENVARAEKDFYPLSIGEDGDTKELFEGIIAILNDKSDGVAPKKKQGMLARGFIYAVADYVVSTALKYDISQVVLSGGTFLNRILTEKVIADLEAVGRNVYISEQLPPGDGGICLGQIALSSPQYFGQ